MNRVLLDTHIFLWALAESGRPRQSDRDLLLDEGTALFLSFASVWEMAIKTSLGKLTLPRPLDEFVAEGC
jgi:PIN domain nuclease of toxin-antitoxin system